MPEDGCQILQGLPALGQLQHRALALITPLQVEDQGMDILQGRHGDRDGVARIVFHLPKPTRSPENGPPLISRAQA